MEADDRVGGRTENHSIGGGKISELMGEYVGPTQDQVVRLGRELGIGTFKTYNRGRTCCSSTERDHVSGVGRVAHSASVVR